MPSARPLEPGGQGFSSHAALTVAPRAPMMGNILTKHPMVLVGKVPPCYAGAAAG
jgi:hypothetical protein